MSSSNNENLHEPVVRSEQHNDSKDKKKLKAGTLLLQPRRQPRQKTTSSRTTDDNRKPSASNARKHHRNDSESKSDDSINTSDKRIKHEEQGGGLESGKDDHDDDKEKASDSESSSSDESAKNNDSIKDEHTETVASSTGVVQVGSSAVVAVVASGAAGVDEHDDVNDDDKVVATSKTTTDEEGEDWTQAQKEMDQMFKEQARDKLLGIPVVEVPAELKATLFPYQREGLSWMHFQETRSEEEAIPPFYFRKPSGKWCCTLTNNHVQEEQPPAVRGGILADDMGLGKTVQTISLLLANPAASFRSRAKAVRDIPRCTLIVCPVSVMANWTTQIQKFVNGQRKVLKVECYHGDSREDMLGLLAENKLDVLVTSYNTLASDYKKREEYETEQEPNKEESVKSDDCIQPVSTTGTSSIKRGSRVAHRNYSEDSSIDSMEDDDESAASWDDDDDDESAASWDDDDDDDSLEEGEPTFIFDHSFHRIILDEAQQIRNAKTDFNKAAMAIDAKHKWCLTGTPFVNKPEDIQSLLQFLGVQPFESMERFKQYVSEPIMNKRAIGLKRLRVATSFCAFRRTKDHVKSVVKLPKKVVVRTLVDFGEGEHATNHNIFYDTLRAILRKILSNDREKTKGGVALLFTMLIRIKQSCCHADLVPEVVRELAAAAHEQRDEIDDPLVLLAMMKTPDDVDTKRKKLGPNFDPRSPKIVALLEQITAMGDGEKGVIFSQFTSYLDIVEKALLSANHTFTRIDGTMNWNQREEAMTKFSTERCDSFKTPRFILCSLMACGTGITLTRGNHVFRMDPWWNSSVEMQAYDRVHRVGQTREVRVVRFMMKDSIEERMVAVQEAKQALGKGSLEKMSKADQEKAKLTTLKDLFQISEEEADNNWDWIGDDLVEDDDVEEDDEEWRG